MNAWWQLWTRFFSPETCEKAIADGLLLPPEVGKIGHGGKPIVQESFRISTIRWVTKDSALGQFFWERIIQRFHEANFNAFGFDLAMLREVQFTEYQAAADGRQGHYNWHEDLCWDANKPYQRKLSMVIQLSNPADYEGGQLELQYSSPPADQLKSRGSIIVFPSFHRHRVTPVTKGTRYSLVAWYDGPNFR